MLICSISSEVSLDRACVLSNAKIIAVDKRVFFIVSPSKKARNKKEFITIVKEWIYYHFAEKVRCDKMSHSVLSLDISALNRRKQGI